MERSLEPAALPRPADEPRVRGVALSRPFAWLRLGARDMARAPRFSLGVGIGVAAFGVLLTGATWKATYLAPALLGGFLLVAPFIALALYAVSRQLERGETPDRRAAWRAWRGNGDSIALFGLVLALAYVFWERVAATVFALFYRGEAVRLSRLAADLLQPDLAVGLAVFFVAGGLLAVLVYALGVVSVPLLLDRPVDVITAVLTSLRSCARNPGPMLLWAALLAGLTAIGFATMMVGLVVVFPLLAHASWHAYRDLVEP